MGGDTPRRFVAPGKFGSPKDSTGAILLDRSPEKFRVILEYLRTGVLERPEGITRYDLHPVFFEAAFSLSLTLFCPIQSESLIIEGEYYCLDSFVEFVKAEEQRIQEELEKPRVLSTPRLRLDGCYLGPHGCYAFIDDNRFVYSSSLPGETDSTAAETRVLAFLRSFPAPALWATTPHLDESLATMSLSVTRGVYGREKDKLMLTIGVNQQTPAFIGPTQLVVLWATVRSRSFTFDPYRYDFKPW